MIIEEQKTDKDNGLQQRGSIINNLYVFRKQRLNLLTELPKIFRDTPLLGWDRVETWVTGELVERRDDLVVHNEKNPDAISSV